MKKRAIFIINIVLIGITIIFAYLIYQQIISQSSQGESQSLVILPTIPENEQAEVLRWPASDATEEEKLRHSSLVQILGQKVDTLVIGKGCSMSPLVIRLVAGETFSIQNQDTTDRTLKVHRDVEFQVLAGETKKTQADFGKGVGNYGYVCDGSGIVGIFSVISE